MKTVKVTFGKDEVPSSNLSGSSPKSLENFGFQDFFA